MFLSKIDKLLILIDDLKGENGFYENLDSMTNDRLNFHNATVNPQCCSSFLGHLSNNDDVWERDQPKMMIDGDRHRFKLI